MIEWTDTFPEQVRAMSDEDLLEAYNTCSGEAGEAVCDAYAAEIERRGLDV